jgi:YEATS domain-containing protein 4
VYGSIAFPLPKTDEYNTHKWTLYVRGPNNEDLSQGIAKVVFQLHPSFAQPVRELTAPPFEVTEKGWGEFEASIRIVWRDPAEKALVLMHMIKLYPPIHKTTNSNSNVNGSVPGSGSGNSGSGTGVDGSGDAKDGEKKEGQPVIHDFYDEVVFTDPTESFHAQLLGSGSESVTRSIPKVESQEPSVQASFQPFSDGKDMHALLEAQKFIESELVAVKDRILRADWSKYELDSAISSVHAKAKAAAAANAPVVPAPAPVKRKSKGSGSSSKKAKTSSSSNSKSSS